MCVYEIYFEMDAIRIQFKIHVASSALLIGKIVTK